MGDRPIICVQTDMSEEQRLDMEQIAAEAALAADFKDFSAIASNVKHQCDARFGGNWHCHVGPLFGSSFPYESNTYFYAEWRDLSIVVYKFG